MRCNSSAGRHRRRALAAGTLAALVTAASLALGCGEEESRSPATGEQQPNLSAAEIESVFERGRLAVVRAGGGDAGDDREDLVELVRYEDRSGREFELFVWKSPRVARRERASLIAEAREQHGKDAAAIRAANAVAVFPARPSSVDAYRAAARTMSRLGAACIRGRDAEERLRRLCFGDGGLPPAGEGADRDEAEEEADAVVVGGLRYQALVARRLNPNTAAGSELVSGRRPPAGKVWFGVFLRVCNEHGGAARRPSPQVALVDASGERSAPRELPADNPFAYQPRPIDPDDCLPREGSAAAQANDGALVLFAVSRRYLTNRPIALEVTADGNAERERLVLDI